MLFPIKINNQRPSNQELCDTDLINTLPLEIFNEIFSFLAIRDLNVCSQVCRNWKAEVDDPEKSKKRIYKQIAFSPEDWKKYFDDAILTDLECNEAVSALPLDIYEILKKSCTAFAGKRVSETHVLVWIPKTIQGKPLTLNSFGELAKRYFPKNATGYDLISTEIVDQEGDKSIDQSGWVLMTKYLLPNSKSKSYEEQQVIVSNLAKKTITGYEIPTVLKITICILTNYFKSGERLFSNKPYTYTCCQESVNSYRLVVGGFGSTGLKVIKCYDHYDVGFAGMRNINVKS